jgi:predicted alpha/beta hydrolase
MITQTSFYRGAGVLLCTRNHHWNIYTDAAFKEISIQMQKKKELPNVPYVMVLRSFGG